MKSKFQIGLLLLIGLGAVGLVTFVAHYNSTTRPLTVEPRGVGQAAALVFPTTSFQWDTQSPQYLAEFEVHEPGHCYFWFQNRQPHAVGLSLAAKSKACNEVRVGIGSAEAWQNYQSWVQTAGPSWCLATGGKEVDVLSPVGLVNWARTLEWHRLEPAEGVELTVPAASTRDAAAVGLVWVGWEANKLGPELVRVELGTRPLPDGRTVPVKLEVPIRGVPPLFVYPSTVDLGEMDPNGSPVTRQVWCWTATREQFTLTAKETNAGPGVLVSGSPLASEERPALASKLASQEVHTRVRWAYRVEISLQPQQIDLGPFQREVLLTSDLKTAPLRLPITGTIRSDVAVGAPKDKGRLNLGNIAASRGETRVVLLTTEHPGMQLEFDSVQPDFLRVKLEEVRQAPGTGKKRWRLHVEVPPNRVAGPFPANSAILLKTQDNSPRRLRIPVLGHAYR